MAISYKKLWKLMIDLDMNKTKLRKEAGLSTNVIAKLSKNDPVSMDTLLRICKALHCDIGDIVETVPDPGHLSVTKYPFNDKQNHLKVAENTHNGYKKA